MLPSVLGKTLNCPKNKEGIVMDWTMILVFLGLSIITGIMAGFGTLSVIRGLFIFLMFLGLAMTALLAELGINEILSFFLGQAIVMGSTYIYLRMLHPEILNRVKKEYTYNGPSHGC
jgi:hypothetical protein